MTRKEYNIKFTVKDFGHLLRTNKSFRDAYNEVNMFFNGSIVSESLLLEIESILKKSINEKK